MSRIALLGSTGYVGSEFARLISASGDELLPIRYSECDLLDPSDLKRAIEAVNPNLVINCAGYTGKPNVDACELDKSGCLAGNAVLPGSLAKACQSLELPFGHVSSGCIYTGAKATGLGFSETDPPNFCFRTNNCSFYSGTKALGEEVLDGIENCYIWRLRIPFSNEDSPRNYLSKLLRYERLLQAENSLSNLTEFAQGCLDSFRKRIPFGVYNLTNPGAMTTRDVVELIKDAGITEKEFSFFESEDEFMKLAAKTPRSNCLLDSSKAVEAGLKLTPIRESIVQALKNWHPE